MDIEYIKKVLNTKTNYNIEYHNKIQSTHTYAINLEISKNNNNKIILTDEQTAGIGTKGKKWHTGNEKNIAMTIIIFPNCNIEKIENITIDIAKSIQKEIKEMFNVDLLLKEPNDLFLNGKKICGILVETKIAGKNVKALYISIGFNVNETSFPEDVANIATSLKKELYKEFDRENIIINFIKRIDEDIIRKVAKLH